MYIVKNAFKCISRSKGRNVLIGIIVLVIAFSACIGLSIRQAAESAKSDALDNLSITATISFDRQSMMNEMRGQGGKPDSDGGEPPSFDRSQFSEMMGESSALSLEEYQTYAEAESVKDFYYSLSASANGSDNFEAVTSEAESSEDESTGTSTSKDNSGFGGQMSPDGGGMGGKQAMMESQGDFQLIGYSGESAMTNFINGSASISDGAIFEEGTSNFDCIISEELATFNELSVGDSVTVTNPNDEEETYELNIVGIYTDTSSNESSFSARGMTFSDPANRIYMSYTALQSIIDSSEDNSADTQITGNLSATYVFEDVEAYEAFETEVRDLGLDDSYTISSQDITSYENSLAPLNTLSKMAGWFLLVILIIGAIILMVLNIFNIRERKYEIGVLTAMGMKKGKVALQFITEIFAVTLVAVIIGVSAGAVSAVPVTNALLENQISSQESQVEQVEQNFGRGGMSHQGGMPNGEMPDDIGGKDKGFAGGFRESANNYISEINSAMNFTVVLQMLGIAVLLTLLTGAVSMLFVMRYEPLKILANRD